jgi:hypothetical protein
MLDCISVCPAPMRLSIFPALHAFPVDITKAYPHAVIICPENILQDIVSEIIGFSFYQHDIHFHSYSHAILHHDLDSPLPYKNNIKNSPKLAQNEEKIAQHFALAFYFVLKFILCCTLGIHFSNPPKSPAMAD